MFIKRQLIYSFLTVTAPYILFVLHAGVLGGWITDDAGISFSYARNLAEGHGLVAQPGSEPVEGYSNFAWVVLLAPFFLVGLFHTILVPKLLSGLLVLTSFLVLFRTFKMVTSRYHLVTALTLTLLSVNTSFVVWSISGLENPLLVLLACLLLYFLVRYDVNECAGVRIPACIGGLSALLAVTRPDGIIYFFVFPGYVLVNHFFWKQSRERISRAGLLLWLGVFIILFGSFLLFRIFYFGDVLPNTYYAKGGSWAGGTSLIEFMTESETYKKVVKLFASFVWHRGRMLVIGLAGVTFFTAFIALTAFLILKKKLSSTHLPFLLLLLASLLAYVLLPPDWMGEYRFATPAFVFLYAFVFLALGTASRNMLFEKKAVIIAATAVIVLLAGLSLFQFALRTRDFDRNPTIAFYDVAYRGGFLYNDFAERLQISRTGSILLPDAGGALYYSKLKVYDLAGLSDRTITRSLYQDGDRKAFYDYIFETARPSFIYIHGYWAHMAKLDSDPRFRRDYVPIREYVDEQVKRSSGETVYSGDYVRKDLLQEHPNFLVQAAAYFR